MLQRLQQRFLNLLVIWIQCPFIDKKIKIEGFKRDDKSTNNWKCFDSHYWCVCVRVDCIAIYHFNSNRWIKHGRLCFDTVYDEKRIFLRVCKTDFK